MIALKSAGREITWAFQFTNPYFIVAMSAVVLVFALNLFGVFEINLPAAATTGLLGWSAREGYCWLVFPGRLRHRPRHALYRALSRDGAWIRLCAIGRHHPAHVSRHRGGNERTLSAPERAAGLASLRPAARSLDGAGETIDGLSSARHSALPALGDRRGARRRRGHLGERVSPRAQYRLLDVRLFFHPDHLAHATLRRARPHPPPRPRQRLLFHRPEVRRHQNRRLQPNDRRLDSPSAPSVSKPSSRKAAASSSISRLPGASPANSTKPPCWKARRCRTPLRATAS